MNKDSGLEGGIACELIKKPVRGMKRTGEISAFTEIPML